MEALVSWQERAGVMAAGAARRYWVKQCSGGLWQAGVGLKPWHPAEDNAHLQPRQVLAAFGPLGSLKMHQLREQAESIANFINHKQDE